MSPTAKRSFWGWGLEGEGPAPEHQQGMVRAIARRLGAEELELRPAPRIDDIELRKPRVAPPATLAGICSQTPGDRAGHHYGKSFRDIVRGARGEFPAPPDFVAFPTNEDEISGLLDWCADANAAAIPYGGGSSVTGGVETDVGDAYAGVVSIDLTRLDRVLEIDRSSRAARVQAGVLGPALEDQLRAHGLTLRHFPQSFEFSTLGGWIATRSGGHYATLYTHIDDFVESVRAVTPNGIWESRRLPGSGAGPSPDRMLIGSEGILGIITEAWMRLQDRPTFRASCTVAFPGDPGDPGDDGFERAAEAVRAISQAGLYPANCRVLDALEASNSGAGSGDESVLILGFESADHPLDAWMQRALSCARDAGGVAPDDAGQTREQAADSRGGGESREGASGAWRNAFLQAPYARDVLVRASVISETFETAITWDRFPEFHRAVMAATRDAVERVCGGGSVSCRFTHVYPDGPAPYYTILAAGRYRSELEQWADIKAAASEVLTAHGATITHHHSVGRDHRPWYDLQRPDAFARALAAAKRELDPAAVLNPGVLLGPRG